MIVWPKDDNGIVDMILGNEGKSFTNFMADPGGATRFGIDLATLRAWRNDNTLGPDDVKKLEEDEARRIYATRYISGPGFDKLTNTDLRAFMCDTAVLFGPAHAIRMLQKALELGQDGVLGDETATKANAGEARHLINVIAVERIIEHAMEASQRPAKLMFLRGWVNRAAKAIT